MKYKSLLYPLLIAVSFLALAGCCLQPRPAAPVVFSGFPSREAVIGHLNNQNARVQQIQTVGATLSVPATPRLRVQIMAQRPRRFRLLAETALTGAELDIGSNDDVFWVWAKRKQPPAIYFARHETFRRSDAARIMPVRPAWLFDAFGLVAFDPADTHEGPVPAGPGRLQMRSILRSPDGDVTRIVVVDDRYGWILEQHLYDVQGRPLAVSRTSRHQYDPVTGVALPRHVEIDLPPAGMSFAIDVSSYFVNQLAGDPSQLWAMPKHEGYPLVDLSDPRSGFAIPGSPPGSITDVPSVRLYQGPRPPNRNAHARREPRWY